MRSTALIITVCLAPAALGQSLNIELGTSGTAPSPFYSAAGPAGVWNPLGITGDFERIPLIGLQGQPLTARYYQYGLSQMLASNIGSTSGDDEALMDDMALSFCNPVDGCVWVENLLNGEYEVVIYALTPNAPQILSPTRVDFGTPGPTPVGGAWPGAHVQGITFSRHRVTIANGKIGLHSGTYNGAFQAGINGIQLTYLDGPPIVSYPTAFAGQPGPLLGGGLAELRLSDDVRLTALCDEASPGLELEVLSTSPTLDPEGVQFRVEMKSSYPAMAAIIEAYDFQSSQFIALGTEVLNLSDTLYVEDLPGLGSSFVHPLSATMRARLRIAPFLELSSMDGWSIAFDQAIWQVDP